MFEKLRNEQGFTLIEMMIVLLVITVLLIVTIPNVTKHNSSINEKGCDAYVQMVQGQVQSYKIENNNKVPTVDTLKEEGYISSNQCASGKEIQINAEGEVSVVKGESNTSGSEE